MSNQRNAASPNSFPIRANIALPSSARNRPLLALRSTETGQAVNQAPEQLPDELIRTFNDLIDVAIATFKSTQTQRKSEYLEGYLDAVFDLRELAERVKDSVVGSARNSVCYTSSSIS